MHHFVIDLHGRFDDAGAMELVKLTLEERRYRRRVSHPQDLSGCK
jgi:hypothetical protein